MKYIDADRFRVEIENLIERYSSIKAKGVLQEGCKGGRLIGYKDILNKLDSFQQEQQEEPDKSLEEAARRYQEGVIVDTTIYYCGACEDVYFANRIADAFISGAKWQAERILEHVKLAYGKVSMNPFDCSEAFEELISKIESI